MIIFFQAFLLLLFKNHGVWRKRLIHSLGSSMKKTSRAFTLIELLVVIAIIAILAALLLPALKSAKDMGKKAVCISNMKQIYLGFNDYAMDYDHFYPKLRNHPSGYEPWWKSNPSTVIPDYLKIQNSVVQDRIKDNGNPSADMKILSCPGRSSEDRKTINQWNGNTYYGASDYCVNGEALGGGTGTEGQGWNSYMKISKFKKPSKIWNWVDEYWLYNTLPLTVNSHTGAQHASIDVR